MSLACVNQVAAIIAGFVLLLCAIAGAVALVLLWHPIQEFLHLRQTIKDRIAEFKAARSTDNRETAGERSEIYLTQAQLEFRELADQVRCFANKQPLALIALRMIQFDVARAETSLLGLVDAIAMERTLHSREKNLQINTVPKTQPNARRKLANNA
jgi:hypothetical protein